MDPAQVMQEPWRLLSFLCIPPSTNPLFPIFYFMFQWTVFEGLEAELGAFKLTLYCATGWVCALALPLAAWFAAGILWPVTATYWSLSIWLAFAVAYPEYTIYIYFILPVKMKWTSWAIGAYLLFCVFTQGWTEAVAIAFGLANFLIFFAPMLVAQGRMAGRAQANKREFAAAQRKVQETMAPRACVQCGAGPDSHLRLCCCARCGEDGKLWCDQHLPAHLAEALAEEAPRPQDSGAAGAPSSPDSVAAPGRKRTRNPGASKPAENKSRAGKKGRQP
jgi:hypothetical protein